MAKLLDNVRSTMKSQDTEGRFELIFTRTPGYLLARLFRALHIHPIAVTLISIVLGCASAFFFVRTDLTANIIAVVLLVTANWLDCADGQLARMTGKKTLVGRVLDGFAGDLWFQFIYVALALRLTPTWGIWGWLLGAYAGYWCHVRQANLADYYRNIHLYVLLGPTRSELDRSHLLQRRYDALSWRSPAWFEKLYLYFYIRYTLRQEHMTPRCQRLLSRLLPPIPSTSPASVVGGFPADAPSPAAVPSPSPSSSAIPSPSPASVVGGFPADAPSPAVTPSPSPSSSAIPSPSPASVVGGFPADAPLPSALRSDFLAGSRPLMPACQALTFDLRIAVLYLSALLNVVWIYFLFEAIVLQFVFFRLRHRHEHLCDDIYNRYLTPSPAAGTTAAAHTDS